MKRQRLTVLLLAGFTSISSLALGAGLPEPDDPTIKPAKSIGGVRLTDSLNEAKAAFGGDGDCVKEVPERGLSFRICVYGDEGEPEGFAAFVVLGGKVEIVGVSTGFDGKRRTLGFQGPLLELATERGDIGLGDRLVKLRKYYPRAKFERNRGLKSATIAGRRGFMLFTTEGSKAGKRITVITLERSVRASQGAATALARPGG